MGSTLPAVGALACHRASFHHRFAVLRATPPCTVAAPRVPAVRAAARSHHCLRAFACRSSGRFRYRHRCPLSPASFCTRCRSRAITQPALPIAPTGNYVSNFFRVAPVRRRFSCLLCCESRTVSAESASFPTWLSSRPHPFSCFAATAADASATDAALTQPIPARKASILSACVFVHPCPGERGRRRT